MKRRSFLKTNSMLLTALPLMSFDEFLLLKIMEESIYEFKIGRFQCTIFRDLMFKYQARDYFINADPGEVQSALKRFGITTEIIPSPYISLLIQDGNRTILVDSGIGFSDKPIVFKGNEFILKGQLGNLLERKGIRNEKITDIVLTHFHPDHIGGVFSDIGQLNYPNATFHMSQVEWDYWHSSKSLSQPPLFKFFVENNVTPLKEKDINFIVQDYQEITEGIISVDAPGHTPGQIALIFSDKNDNLLYISDAFLHPLHIENLDWRTSFDLDHELARKSRMKLLGMATEKDMHINAFHFDFPGMGRVMKENDKWNWFPGK
ncbi:MBL fold metallo-hydrolase [Muricauda sp. JGD-17]|uniref:MBL fold metallo-hydrolase n=1 Tax=Flagellimonas ochracea TaxID=2696472 RepID=A0A964WY28_9FLAO|nr:MBL fold metallo-hydrolase [Allomuricauda ochracea]NAY92184.1 MBL fold metallo-hydrolase [Allomuricauda ochracea]